MQRICLIGVLVIFCTAAGCQDRRARIQQQAAPDRSSKGSLQVGEAGAEPDQDAGYWSQVTSLYERAKASGETSATSAKEWIGELYDSGSASATETSTWVRGMYDRAKETGETSADDMKEWVLDDIQQIGSWQYKTLQIDRAHRGGAVAQLNKLGAQRWECFWVEQEGETTTFYLKKAGRSYLRHLPSKELIRLLPLIGGQGPSE